MAKTSDKPMLDRLGLTIVPLACASSTLVFVPGPECARTGVVLLRIINLLIRPLGSFFTAASAVVSVCTSPLFPTLFLILFRTPLSLLDKLPFDAVLVKENLEARLADELDRGRFLSHCGNSFFAVLEVG